MTFVYLDIEKKVTHREPNRWMFAIRGTTFTHCRAFLYWLYRFCFEKKNRNGQDLIMVPNENETEIRGLLIVVQKLYMMILKFCLKYPKKNDNTRKSSIPSQYYWLALPRKLFATITNVRNQEMFIIEEFCHYKKSEMIKAFN